MENEIYLISDKGVEVTKNGYDKLISVGYIHNEINTISEEEYFRIINMNVVSVQTNEYYVKTVWLENPDGTYESNDEIISFEQFRDEIDDKNKSSDISIAAISPDIVIDDGSDLPGGGSTDQTEYSSATTEYKYLTVTGTFYKN